MDIVEMKKDLENRRASGTLRKGSDAFKTMTEIANENGFTVESYQVITDDGYILGLYRIPGKIGEEVKDVSKPAVLLMHGLEADMMQWVFNTPDQAPAFVLARAGYDVWMGNNRGTRWSEKHTSLTTKDKAFWQFTWEEMGTHDVPAFTDHILKTTGLKKISYCGHSEGTSQLMSGASLIPDYYNEKFNLAILLAPPAGMKNNSVIIFKLMSVPLNRSLITDAITLVGLYDFLPWNYLASGGYQFVCKLFDGKLCDFALSIFGDADPKIDNMDRQDIYLSNIPAGSSYLNVVHYGQLIDYKVDTFCRFDHGQKENMVKYGQINPPEYDMSLIKLPIAIMSGKTDKLADPADVAWTAAQLKHTTIFNHEYYLGHMSFAIAKDMSFFTVDAMAIFNHYNEKCDASTLNSRFEVGNEKCATELGLF
jgi:pimeloyl-ACP methyl ester carboxylesterase